MITKFVDTNILLEALLRKGAKSDRCQKLLNSDGKFLCSWLVVAEFEWVLRSVYKLKRGEIAVLISLFLSLSSLQFSDKKALLGALGHYKGIKTDWTDCLNAALMKVQEINELYSYDRDFDKFPGIKRLEP